MEEERVIQSSAYVWKNKHGRTQITLDLDDFFKVFSGKKISLEVIDESEVKG